MNSTNTSNPKSLYEQLGGNTVVNKIVEIFYSKILADYRLNRFFNTGNENEQQQNLTALVLAKCGVSTEKSLTELLDDFFLSAFAKQKRKSFVNGSDFNFLGYIVAQNKPSTQYLCEAHSHLLRFMPDDFHYDAIIENLNAAMSEMLIDKNLTGQALALAESARSAVLGK